MAAVGLSKAVFGVSTEVAQLINFDKLSFASFNPSSLPDFGG